MRKRTMNAGDAEVGMKSRGNQLQLMIVVSGCKDGIDDNRVEANLRKQNMVEL